MFHTKTLLVSAIVALSAAGACSYAQPTAEAPATEAAAAAVTVDGPTIVAGTFSGLSDHITTGGATIVGTDGNYTLVFADDFSLDGAPDPVVGFGNDGKYDTSSQLGALTRITGGQSYALPADFSPSSYGEVYVWCEQFSVPLGVASLTSETQGS